MKPVIVIDDVANADSTMDNDDGCRKFMVNAVSKHSPTMSEDIDVPILCLDDDDDDYLNTDEDYKLFLQDHLTHDNNLVPPFEDDNGESETRTFKLNMLYNDSNRSKLGGTEKPIKNRVSQQGKRKTFGFETEVSRAFPLAATTRESMQRDNRVAERRKRKIAELEATNQVNIQRDNKARKLLESTKVDTSWDVPLVRTLEVIKRDYKARKLSESKVDTSWDVPSVRAQEVLQRDNKARKLTESKVDTLWDVPLVRAKEVIKRDNRARKLSESKVDTLWDVPLARTLELTQRDNRISKQRKKKVGETKATETSKVLPVEPKAVDETSRKKNVEESVAVVDNDYMGYFIWLVDSFKDQTTLPDPSDINPPNPETQKESTTVPENNHLLTKVKVDLESQSDDDDDIIAVSDSPFLDGETTPFVVSKSKNVIDLEKDNTEDDESGVCVFKKELMNVLKKPYDEGELLLLSSHVSVKKRVSRCRELRKGRERSYETFELGQSYLEKVSDFDKEYKRVHGDDKTRLELLRGFFFYLENISLPGSFKPWLPDNRDKLGQRKQP